MNKVGSRENTGGARENSGGARPGPGRPKRNWVTELDVGHREDQGDHVPVGPVNAPFETSQTQTAGSSSSIAETRLRRAPPSKLGLFDVFYMRGWQGETVRYAQGKEVNKSLPQDIQRVYDTRRRCSKCDDRNHNAESCSHEVWNLKMFNCK